MSEEFTDLPDADSDSEEFAHLLSLGASLSEPDFEMMSPPADLWDRIAAGASLAEPTVLTELTVLAEPTVLADRRKSGSRSGGSPNSGRRIVLAAAAAVLILVVGAVGVRLVDSSRTSTELVASTTLDVLEGPATAQAKLLRSGDTERLVVTTENMPAAPTGSHYELWLVDPKVTRPQSLGPMTGSTEVVIPASIDPAIYPVVDISLQQNGTHDHSGHSLLRGTLQ
jgi:hypothetical protein